MKVPSDYVEKSTAELDSNGDPIGAEPPMTIRKVVDRFNSNQPITDEMINAACRQMDSVYHFKNDAPVASSQNPLRKFFKSVF